MNYNVKCKSIESAQNMTKMFELRKQISISSMYGNYKETRKAQKQLADIALKDFDAYTSLPHMHITLPPMSIKETLTLAGKMLKMKLLYAFSRKTSAEKQLAKKYKEYAKTQTPEDIKKKTLDITIPSLY